MFAPDSPEVVAPNRFTEVSGSATPDYDQTLRVELPLQRKAEYWRYPQSGIMWRSDPSSTTTQKNKKRIRLWRDEPWPPTLRRLNGSWRHMFISDPPCTAVRCTIDIAGAYGDPQLDFKVEHEEGVTLGIVEDVVQTALEVGRKPVGQGRMPSSVISQGIRLRIYVDFLMTKDKAKMTSK